MSYSVVSDPLNDDVLATGRTPRDLAHRVGEDGRPACGMETREVHRYGVYRVLINLTRFCRAEACFPMGCYQWEKRDGSAPE